MSPTTQFVPYQEQLRDRTDEVAATVRIFSEKVLLPAPLYSAEDEGVHIIRPYQRAFFVDFFTLL